MDRLGNDAQPVVEGMDPVRPMTGIPERHPVVYRRRPVRVDEGLLRVDQPQTFIGSNRPDHLGHDVVDRANIKFRPHVNVVA